jgi:hypothetical protein
VLVGPWLRWKWRRELAAELGRGVAAVVGAVHLSRVCCWRVLTVAGASRDCGHGGQIGRIMVEELGSDAASEQGGSWGPPGQRRSRAVGQACSGATE